MKLDVVQRDPGLWRPQAKFSASLASKSQISAFNDSGGVAVYIDTDRAVDPDISILGSQSEKFSFWETRSKTGFVTKPKFKAGLSTFRFVTEGTINYLLGDSETIATKMTAVLTGFDNLVEVRGSSSVATISVTIGNETLLSAQKALTGNADAELPALGSVADVAMPGISALFCSIRLLSHRIKDGEWNADQPLSLLQEIISYQILSHWPKSQTATPTTPPDLASRRLQLAIDYIEEHLSATLTLAEIASAAGTGVRSLQYSFKREIGRTPVQYIIDRRLARTHEDLTSPVKMLLSVTEIARSWGFTHMSDFGQRYRRQYGCTPSATRREAEQE